ncbi:coiled-coil domain-containing protein 55-domain containing protein [Mucidula mucida]|nr:coiled-coil domain-containing protein 55-domain containing protein [Mucidula mucida]
MKLSFSLGKPKQPAEPAPSLKRPAAFASLDDDEPVDAAVTSSAKADAAANKQLLAQNVGTSRKLRKIMEQEKKVDETVYEYDEVWDLMQMAKQKQKEAKEVDAAQRKPKYIHGLLASAQTRKLDHLRAEEKMMQHEREMEGDEFKDKDAFVTQAYKDQMAEVRRAEEEEKRRDALQKSAGPSSGMSHYYRQLLEESEQRHEATVAATQKTVIGPQGPAPNLTITKPADFTPVSDLELARIARTEGKEVELNDDNQIVDKRELLAAGLNLSGTNTRKLGRTKQSQAQKDETDVVQTHRAVGTAASRREINERRAREIQQQLESEKERVAREKKQADDEALARVVAKRNTEADVQSARERYLARKREKLEASSVPSMSDA